MLKNQPDITLGYLADHIDHLPTLAKWFHDEWHGDAEGWSFDQTLEYIRKNDCNKEHLNITLIAMDKDQLVGSAQLMKEDLLPGWDHVGPWIGGLYVAPGYRHHGIAFRLGYTLITKAMNMGFEEIYMFTDKIHRLPQRHHMQTVGKATYGKKKVTIYKKELF